MSIEHTLKHPRFDHGLVSLVRENRPVLADEKVVRAMSVVLDRYSRLVGQGSGAQREGVPAITLADGVPYAEEALDVLLDAQVLRVPDDYDAMSGQDAFLTLDADRLSGYVDRSRAYDHPQLRAALGSVAKEGPLRVQSSEVIADEMYAILEHYAASGTALLGLRDYLSNSRNVAEAVGQLEDLGVLSSAFSEQGLGTVYEVNDRALLDIIEAYLPAPSDSSASSSQ